MSSYKDSNTSFKYDFLQDGEGFQSIEVDTEGAKSFRGAKLSPDVVAQAVIQGLERNVYDIRVGQVNALYLASRLSPALAQRILDNVASKP